MKILNWIILACTFIGAVGAEAAKDRAKLKSGQAEARSKGLKPGHADFPTWEAGYAVPRLFRGAIYGMVGGTAFNEAVLPALQGMGGE